MSADRRCERGGFWCALVAGLLIVAITSGGCRDRSNSSRPTPGRTTRAPQNRARNTDPTRPASPRPNKFVGKPQGRFLFQPVFYYEDREPSANGTGFLVRGPNDRIAAIASAHFVDFEGTVLLETVWLSIGDWEPMLAFDKSWGMPGNEGVADGDSLDISPDYFILPVEEDVPDEWVLKLDKREGPAKKEVVWFPNKTDDAVNGYLWVHGTVVEAKRTHIFVLLEKRVELQSQSGSPIISSRTGRVIGTLSRSSELQGKTVLWLCPAQAIRDAIKTATTFPLLKDVVGKPQQ